MSLRLEHIKGLPPIANNQLKFLRLNSDATGFEWASASVSATNGLDKDGDSIILGGTLNRDTTIDSTLAYALSLGGRVNLLGQNLISGDGHISSKSEGPMVFLDGEWNDYGGTLTPGSTYYFAVYGIDSNGNYSTISNEVYHTVEFANAEIDISFGTAIPFAKYRVYIGTQSGVYNRYFEISGTSNWFILYTYGTDLSLDYGYSSADSDIHGSTAGSTPDSTLIGKALTFIISKNKWEFPTLTTGGPIIDSSFSNNFSGGIIANGHVNLKNGQFNYSSIDRGPTNSKTTINISEYGHSFQSTHVTVPSIGFNNTQLQINTDTLDTIIFAGSNYLGEGRSLRDALRIGYIGNIHNRDYKSHGLEFETRAGNTNDASDKVAKFVVTAPYLYSKLNAKIEGIVQNGNVSKSKFLSNAHGIFLQHRTGSIELTASGFKVVNGESMAGNIPGITSQLSGTYASGGNFTPGKYYIVPVIYDSMGNYSVTEEVVYNIVNPASRIALVFNHVPGAVKYRFYIGNTSGGQDRYYETTSDVYAIASYGSGDGATMGTVPNYSTSYAVKMKWGGTTAVSLEVNGTSKFLGAILLHTSLTDKTAPIDTVDGSMFYNSSSNKFRGRVSGAWKNFLMEGDVPTSTPVNPGDFIQNQISSPQTANFYVSGTGIAAQLGATEGLSVTAGIPGAHANETQTRYMASFSGMNDELGWSGKLRIGYVGSTVRADRSMVIDGQHDGLGPIAITLQSLGGNVGIGKMNPQHTLDVSGTGRFTSDVRASAFVMTYGGTDMLTMQMASGTEAMLEFKGGGNGYQHIMFGNNHLKLVPWGGKVGINLGSTDPTYNLDIIGQQRIRTSGDYGLLLTNTHTSDFTGIHIRGSVDFTSAQGFFIRSTVAGSTYFDHSTHITQSFVWSNYGDERMRLTNGGTLLIAGATNQNGVPDVSTFNLQVNGGVLIGNNRPSSGWIGELAGYDLQVSNNIRHTGIHINSNHGTYKAIMSFNAQAGQGVTARLVANNTADGFRFDVEGYNVRMGILWSGNAEVYSGYLTKSLMTWNGSTGNTHINGSLDFFDGTDEYAIKKIGTSMYYHGGQSMWFQTNSQIDYWINGAYHTRMNANGTYIYTISNGTGDFLTRNSDGLIRYRTAAEVKTDLGLTGTGSISAPANQIVYGTDTGITSTPGFRYFQDGVNVRRLILQVGVNGGDDDTSELSIGHMNYSSTSGLRLKHKGQNGKSYINSRVDGTSKYDLIINDEGQNVLIGNATSAGDYKLQVYGTAHMSKLIVQSQGESGSPAIIELNSTLSGNGTWSGKIVTDYFGGSYNGNVGHGMSFIGGRDFFDHFRWFTSGLVETMTLFKTGNLSLGNGNNPTDGGYKIDVNGSSRFTGESSFGRGTSLNHTDGLEVGYNAAFSKALMIGNDTNLIGFGGNGAPGIIIQSNAPDDGGQIMWNHTGYSKPTAAFIHLDFNAPAYNGSRAFRVVGTNYHLSGKLFDIELYNGQMYAGLTGHYVKLYRNAEAAAATAPNVAFDADVDGFNRTAIAFRANAIASNGGTAYSIYTDNGQVRIGNLNNADDGVDYMVGVNNGVLKRMAIPTAGGTAVVEPNKQIVYGTGTGVSSSNMHTLDTANGFPILWIDATSGGYGAFLNTKANGQVHGMGTLSSGDWLLGNSTGGYELMRFSGNKLMIGYTTSQGDYRLQVNGSTITSSTSQLISYFKNDGAGGAGAVIGISSDLVVGWKRRAGVNYMSNGGGKWYAGIDQKPEAENQAFIFVDQQGGLDTPIVSILDGRLNLHAHNGAIANMRSDTNGYVRLNSALVLGSDNPTIYSEQSSIVSYSFGYQGHTISIGGFANSNCIAFKLTPFEIAHQLPNYVSSLLDFSSGYHTSHSSPTTLRGLHTSLHDNSTQANTLIGISADVSGGTNTNATRYAAYLKGGKVWVGDLNNADDNIDYMVGVNNGVLKRMTIPSGGTGTTISEPANQIVYGTGTGVDSSAYFSYDGNYVSIGGNTNTHAFFLNSLSATGGNTGAIQWSNTDIYIRNNVAGNLSFGTNGIDGRMILNADGKLLAGYTTSQGDYRLQVNGGGFISVVEQEVLRLVSTGGNSLYQTFHTQGTFRALIGISGGTDGHVVGSTTGDLAFRTANHNILFSANNGSSAHLRINTDGKSRFNGSLGINAPAPEGTYYALVVGSAIDITGEWAGFQLHQRDNQSNVWQHYSTAGNFHIWNQGTFGSANQFTIEHETGAISIRNLTIADNVDYMVAVNNGKLKRMTIPTGGTSLSGTPNNVPKFSNTTSLGSSVIWEVNGQVGINKYTPRTDSRMTIVGMYTTEGVLQPDSVFSWYATTLDNVATGSLSDAGNLRIKGTLVSYYNFSDLRLKRDVIYQAPETMLQKVMKLQPVTYQWKEKDGVEYGFIAQEVEEVLPEVINEYSRLGDDAMYKSVDYKKLTSVLAGAIQQLKAELDEVKQQLK